MLLEYLNKLYELIFGHCLVCLKYQYSITICQKCSLKFHKNIFCLHDKSCQCRKDIIPYFYNSYSKKILLRAKYSDDYYSLRFIAQSIINLMVYKPDYLVPIPTSKKKLFQKGYNTPGEICKILSIKLDIPIIYPLKKNKKTFQKGMSYEKRLKNVKHMIYDFQGDLSNKKIAIIDDLMASGATIQRAKELLKDHCEDIFIWIFAKT